jgi:hypothetical protein
LIGWVSKTKTKQKQKEKKPISYSAKVTVKRIRTKASNCDKIFSKDRSDKTLFPKIS